MDAGRRSSHSHAPARRTGVHTPMTPSTSPRSLLGGEIRAALVAMVRKRVPESEVDDIVQATLTEAVVSPHAPSEAEALRRWLFGVAKNKVADFHRKRGRESFDSSYLLDEKPKRRIDEVLIELTATNPFRQRDLSHFARHTCTKPYGGSQHSLGHGQQVCFDGHFLFIRGEIG